MDENLNSPVAKKLSRSQSFWTTKTLEIWWGLTKMLAWMEDEELSVHYSRFKVDAELFIFIFI
jgi:hypothetical protein